MNSCLRHGFKNSIIYVTRVVSINQEKPSWVLCICQQICCPETLNICLPGTYCDPEVCHINENGEDCCKGDDGEEECYPVGQPYQCDDNLILYPDLIEYHSQDNGDYEYGQYNEDYGKIFILLEVL